MNTNNIKAIFVEIENLPHRTNIYYHTVTNHNSWTWYNEKNVPDYIVELMNKNRPSKQWETEYTNTGTKTQTIVYKF